MSKRAAHSQSNAITFRLKIKIQQNVGKECATHLLTTTTTSTEGKENRQKINRKQFIVVVGKQLCVVLILTSFLRRGQLGINFHLAVAISEIKTKIDK